MERDFEAMKRALKGGGVRVVVAPQLFETPWDLAREMVARSQLHDGESVLEPSAGTGRLVNAAREVLRDGLIQCVEINHAVAQTIAA